MTRRNAFLDECRAIRQRQSRLGDVAIRLVDQQLPEAFDLGLGGRRANQHAVTAGAMHFLDHQFAQVIKHILQLIGLATHVGRHVVQDRLFAEIKADHFRHIGIDRLVVGNAGAYGVRQRDIPGLISLQNTRHAQGGIRTEGERIHEIVVNAAIDDIDALGPLRRAHVDHFILDEKITPFDQFDPHLLGQESVFEVGAVVRTRRQHDDGWVADPDWRHRPQLFQQHVRVMLHRRHLVFGEQFREEAHHHLAVFEHVGDARRHAQIVFQHVELARAGAHDIDPGNVCINLPRQVNALHHRAILRIIEHLLGGNLAGLEDFLIVIDIVQEHVERLDALAQTRLQ